MNPTYNHDPPSKAGSHNGSMTSISLAPSESKSKDTDVNKNNSSDTKSKERNILAAIRSFVIVLALSIHAIFEGMAIGRKYSRVLYTLAM